MAVSGCDCDFVLDVYIDLARQIEYISDASEICEIPYPFPD